MISYRTALKCSFSGVGITGEDSSNGDMIRPTKAQKLFCAVAHAIDENWTGKGAQLVP